MPKLARAATISDLQGDWEAVSIETRCTYQACGITPAGYRLMFRGTDVWETTDGEAEMASVILDRSEGEPRISFHYPPFFGKEGRYRLDGETLTITWGIGKQMWPSEGDHQTVVLKRMGSR